MSAGPPAWLVAHELVDDPGRDAGVLQPGREGMKAGAQVPNNDCWIAACCVVHNHPLLTHHQDFKPLAAQGYTLL